MQKRSAVQKCDVALVEGRLGGAQRLLVDAAQSGDAEAQFSLGTTYEIGVRDGDTHEAIFWYESAAEQGHAHAQLKLGIMYERLDKRSEAKKWYALSAEQGLVEAQNWLGFELFQGSFADWVEALKWFRKAAEKGLASAQVRVGLMYWDGKGVPECDDEAVNWFHLAAKQGDADGQFYLARAFEHGFGVPENKKEALRWYRSAAEQGHYDAQFKLDLVEDDWCVIDLAEQGDAEAQCRLGDKYASGEDVDEDIVEAFKWYNLAAAQGHEDAKEAKKVIRKDMTPAQIAEAQRLSAEWKPKQ
jgi:TPR repeat protein